MRNCLKMETKTEKLRILKVFIVVTLFLIIVVVISGASVWVRPINQTIIEEDYIQAYGEMWNSTATNVTAYQFTMPEADTFFNLTGLKVGNLVNFTFTNANQARGGSFLTTSIDGVYLINLHLSFSSSGRGLYDVTVSKNFDRFLSEECYARRKIGKAILEIGSLSITCLLDLEDGDTVNIQVKDEQSPVRNIFVHTANLNVVLQDEQ